MGHDTYAARAPDTLELNHEDLQAFQDLDLGLSEWLVFEDTVSFQARHYVNLIFDITGQSLYEEWIPPETVREMYLTLEECEEEKVNAISEKYEHRDILELRRFFRACAERGLGLINSW